MNSTPDTRAGQRPALNQYQGGMCISGSLTMTEMTPRHLDITFRPQLGGHR